MRSFEEIIHRLKELCNVTKDKEMYDLMEVKSNIFINWKQKNKIPYDEMKKKFWI